MGIEIKTWQIVDGGLRAVTTTLKCENRREPYDLEPWIQSNPAILGPDIAIIGRQTRSKSGPIDLLGIDKSGNIVIVELKRDKLPREALAKRSITRPMRQNGALTSSRKYASNLRASRSK